jgi:phage/plasmid-like protein (TIGR03299 family)
MAHNLDFSTGQAAIAFLGSRNDIWHKHGQEKQPGESIESWAKDARLDWNAVKVPAIAALQGAQFDHLDPTKRFVPVEDRFFVVRTDNGHPLGYVSNIYQPVQPIDVLEWFQKYISVDDRFQLDVAGALKQGEIIWATATFREPLSIAGDKHVARLLMTTTFDGSGSTLNQATMTRTVCNNTLDVALADKRAVIRTRHSTKFDGAKVGKELATLAQGFASYKKLGDALALNEISKGEISEFFKGCLDIPFDAKQADISPRKLNQFAALGASYRATVKEGTQPNTAWAALNSVTRYVDHDAVFSSKPASDEKRFLSTQFGHGANLKAKAMGLLLPRVQDKVLIAA